MEAVACLPGAAAAVAAASPRSGLQKPTSAVQCSWRQSARTAGALRLSTPSTAARRSQCAVTMSANGHTFAVVEVGSHQYRVAQDDIIYTEKLQGVEPGDQVELGRVLLLGGGDKLAVGTPYVENAVVRAQMLRLANDRKKVFDVRPKIMSVLKVLELHGPEGVEVQVNVSA
eukprot:jgi/Chlat1/2763/Chrsp187S00195